MKCQLSSVTNAFNCELLLSYNLFYGYNMKNIWSGDKKCFMGKPTLQYKVYMYTVHVQYFFQNTIISEINKLHDCYCQ